MKLKLVILEDSNNASKREVMERDADFHSAYAFEDAVLEKMNQRNIEIYAEHNLAMIPVDEVEDPVVSEFCDVDLKDELEKRGYRVIRCKTITEAMQLDEILNQTTLTS